MPKNKYQRSSFVVKIWLWLYYWPRFMLAAILSLLSWVLAGANPYPFSSRLKFIRILFFQYRATCDYKMGRALTTVEYLEDIRALD